MLIISSCLLIIALFSILACKLMQSTSILAVVELLALHKVILVVIHDELLVLLAHIVLIRISLLHLLLTMARCSMGSSLHSLTLLLWLLLLARPNIHLL